MEFTTKLHYALFNCTPRNYEPHGLLSDSADKPVSNNHYFSSISGHGLEGHLPSMQSHLSSLSLVCLPSSWLSALE